MVALLGKSWSFCSSILLSDKCFVMFHLCIFRPGVYVGTLNLVAAIPGPSILTLVMTADPDLESEGSGARAPLQTTCLKHYLFLCACIYVLYVFIVSYFPMS